MITIKWSSINDRTTTKIDFLFERSFSYGRSKIAGLFITITSHMNKGLYLLQLLTSVFIYFSNPARKGLKLRAFLLR